MAYWIRNSISVRYNILLSLFHVTIYYYLVLCIWYFYYLPMLSSNLVSVRFEYISCKKQCDQNWYDDNLCLSKKKKNAKLNLKQQTRSVNFLLKMPTFILVPDKSTRFETLFNFLSILSRTSSFLYPSSIISVYAVLSKLFSGL